MGVHSDALEELTVTALPVTPEHVGKWSHNIWIKASIRLTS